MRKQGIAGRKQCLGFFIYGGSMTKEGIDPQWQAINGGQWLVYAMHPIERNL